MNTSVLISQVGRPSCSLCVLPNLRKKRKKKSGREKERGVEIYIDVKIVSRSREKWRRRRRRRMIDHDLRRLHKFPRCYLVIDLSAEVRFNMFTC